MGSLHRRWSANKLCRAKCLDAHFFVFDRAFKRVWVQQFPLLGSWDYRPWIKQHLFGVDEREILNQLFTLFFFHGVVSHAVAFQVTLVTRFLCFENHFPGAFSLRTHWFWFKVFSLDLRLLKNLDLIVYFLRFSQHSSKDQVSSYNFYLYKKPRIPLLRG